MPFINRKTILDALADGGALTPAEMGKPENNGFGPDQHRLKFLLQQLVIREQVQVLAGTTPLTYVITRKGMEERKKLCVTAT